MTHPDVPAEQAHVDLAYERLYAMRAAAETMLQDAFGERGGTFQAVTERDMRVRHSLGRIEHLRLGRESLVFGRIDQGEDEDRPRGAFHIGRLAISDVDQEPLVVDWRAPVAEPFYRATGAHPMGLERRRHFLTDGSVIVDIEDELFDPEGSDSGVGLGLSGPQVLLATLERSRTGRMRDIVATVQREQDEIIRGPLAGILVVQGGPGTGKTAVALHRAAYLLYTHRFPLETQGVLVVGPNPTFLRYIEHVLPSLDETGVELSTVNGLYHRSKATGTEDRRVAALKGTARMAKFLSRAVSDRERPLKRPVEVPYGSRILRLSPSISAQIVSAVKRRPGTHNARRRLVENTLWRHLLDQMGDESTRGRHHSPPEIPEVLGRALRRQPAVVEALDRMWPLLTPEEFLHDLFGAPALVTLAASGVLSEVEAGLLIRQRSAPGTDVAWTEADVPLLDEAYGLLGPRRRGRVARSEQVRTFGHIVVDETQDLSPMQLRMIARRSLSGSMTVVGDIGQATGSWVPGSWNQVIEHLPARRGWRFSELTVSYRTPKEIMDLAARVLEHAAPGMRAPESVRAGGTPPRIVGTSRSGSTVPLEALLELAGSEAAAEVELIRASAVGGTSGVIAPPSLIDEVVAALLRRGISCGRAGRAALDETVTVLTIEDVKGLEFDSVIVVDPARVIAETPQGLRALYVAFTRATQRLVIVHAGALPSPLVGAIQHTA